MRSHRSGYYVRFRDQFIIAKTKEQRKWHNSQLLNSPPNVHVEKFERGHKCRAPPKISQILININYTINNLIILLQQRSKVSGISMKRSFTNSIAYELRQIIWCGATDNYQRNLFQVAWAAGISFWGSNW